MNKYFFYFNGTSNNHGCEAICRATHKILALDRKHSLYCSFDCNIDRKFGLEQITTLVQYYNPIKSSRVIQVFFGIIRRLFKTNSLYNKLVYSSIIKASEGSSIAFSIGGDNYCKVVESMNNPLIYVNKKLTKRKIKTVLWGCSIEPEVLEDEEVISDMLRYSLITARESLTYNALIAKGIKENVYLIPDPAFLLDTVFLPLPKGFIEKDTVGINVSPLILSFESNKGIVLENYKNLIRYIIENTNLQIALIPHVVDAGNDDRVVLRELYDIFRDTGRLVLIEDCNCMELKGYIARCRFFIGARTHATIAAYSSCVPTLVVGYSVKAKGLATDIFGSYDHYVISVQSLDNENNLMDAFCWMMEYEIDIRNHLKNFIPSYVDKAWSAGRILNNKFYNV